MGKGGGEEAAFPPATRNTKRDVTVINIIIHFVAKERQRKNLTHSASHPLSYPLPLFVLDFLFAYPMDGDGVDC